MTNQPQIRMELLCRVVGKGHLKEIVTERNNKEFDYLNESAPMRKKINLSNKEPNIYMHSPTCPFYEVKGGFSKL